MENGIFFFLFFLSLFFCSTFFLWFIRDYFLVFRGNVFEDYYQLGSKQSIIQHTQIIGTPLRMVKFIPTNCFVDPSATLYLLFFRTKLNRN